MGHGNPSCIENILEGDGVYTHVALNLAGRTQPAVQGDPLVQQYGISVVAGAEWIHMNHDPRPEEKGYNIVLVFIYEQWRVTVRGFLQIYELKHVHKMSARRLDLQTASADS